MKEKKNSEENTVTDTATVNFASVSLSSQSKKDSAIEVDQLTAFFC